MTRFGRKSREIRQSLENTKEASALNPINVWDRERQMAGFKRAGQEGRGGLCRLDQAQRLLY